MFDNPAIWMFPALFALIFLGVPVSFSLICVSFGFGVSFFGTNIGLIFFNQFTGVAKNYVLSAVPLFIFMGTILERSGIAERLFLAMRMWVGRLPGGLALASIAMCGVFAATTGIVGAVETVIGMMAIPPMLRYGYSRDLISGTICSGGSLGTIIPPTLVAVIYGSIVEVPIGDLFAGIMIPGMIMLALFMLYILIRCTLRPEDGPRAPKEEQDVSLGEKLRVTLVAFVPAAVLIVAVLGSILAGIASATEAAGVGALGGLALTIAYGRLSVGLLIDVLRRTLAINAMIMFIVVGGTIFTSVFFVNGGNRMIAQVVRDLALEPAVLISLLLGIVFMLGFVLDWISIVLICMPIFRPLIEAAGIDPIWFGVMVAIIIQTSYLTPPMAPSIFYLRAIAPPEITYSDMFRGVLPFIVCQILTLLVVAFIPEAATWLPSLLFGF